MSAHSTLPIRCSIAVDESFVGFLLRMANANHLRGLHWLYKLLKRESVLRIQPEDLPAVATISGTSAGRLEQAFILPYAHADKLSYRAHGHKISRLYLLRPLRPQLCPICVHEYGYIRAIWDFSLVTACTDHGCALIDTCPACSRTIRWSRPYFNACICGMFWRNVHPEHLPSDHPSITIAAVVSQKLGRGNPSDGPIACPVIAMLSAVRLDTLFQLIWIFGVKEAIAFHAPTCTNKAIPRTASAKLLTERAFQRLSSCIGGSLKGNKSVSREIHIPGLLSLAKDLGRSDDALWVATILQRLGRCPTFQKHRSFSWPEQLTLF